jgi:hypothetical protein
MLEGVRRCQWSPLRLPADAPTLLALLRRPLVYTRDRRRVRPSGVPPVLQVFVLGRGTGIGARQRHGSSPSRHGWLPLESVGYPRNGFPLADPGGEEGRKGAQVVGVVRWPGFLCAVPRFWWGCVWCDGRRHVHGRHVLFRRRAARRACPHHLNVDLVVLHRPLGRVLSCRPDVRCWR